ncbi:MAG: hypothetical protein ACK5MI_01835 [Mangrovibacterium sp.]
MSKLIEINNVNDILPEYRNTPIGLLLEYHNLNKVFTLYEEAELMIGMCADHRISLWLPDNFAYIFRTGGANLFYQEFQVSYTIGVGNIKHIALIANNECRMEKLNDVKDCFIEGMVKNAGWDAENARNHFEGLAPFFEIGNSIEFILSEAARIHKRYPKVQVAPLFFDVNSKNLSQIVAE